MVGVVVRQDMGHSILFVPVLPLMAGMGGHAGWVHHNISRQVISFLLFCVSIYAISEVFNFSPLTYEVSLYS